MWWDKLVIQTKMHPEKEIATEGKDTGKTLNTKRSKLQYAATQAGC